MMSTWRANWPTPWIATSPATPKRYTVVVCTTRYRDSKPMIEGVMIRLFVTVWKLTVATAWATATSAITTTAVARCWAMRQNPGVPTGSGLSQARRPNAEPRAITPSTTSTTM